MPARGGTGCHFTGLEIREIDVHFMLPVCGHPQGGLGGSNLIWMEVDRWVRKSSFLHGSLGLYLPWWSCEEYFCK